MRATSTTGDFGAKEAQRRAVERRHFAVQFVTADENENPKSDPVLATDSVFVCLQIGNQYWGLFVG